MMRPKIWFYEHEFERICKQSGLSELELLGLIELMNQFTYSQEAIDEWNYDERMGRHID